MSDRSLSSVFSRACSAALALALSAASAWAAPGGTLSPGERPADSQQRPPLKLSYGLCDGPSNAEAFPSSAVPVVEEQCHNSQQFESTAPNASYGGSCGGYTTAFGPLGALKPSWKSRRLQATWAGEPLTAATCPNARIAAIAWGWRCNDASCSTGTWEKLGAPVSKKGTWNTVSQVCYISASFGAPPANLYATLNIDAIATVYQGGQWVRQPVAAKIRASSPNGKCPSATYTPHTEPSAQAASQVKIEKKYP